ncbi:hypothetical protein KUTeg_022753 [Tegillarca granosa]|uniref:DNA 3'-5' helicase n=1 Tax=Tegillarca granosa TaxID=220873 RepID=A0ABQ9E5Y2_TEGGR|nr:hypothetical protein KUTeg_022753 [Tegillarca granosa]
MGIDKPDVRFVIHHSLSKSMENLYQESGRAGRDDKVSHCILYYRFADVFRQSTMVFTEQTGLDNLYGIMEYCTDMKKCRRSIIARHFGEVWDKAQCNAMCDHCDSTPVPKERKDVTKVCLNMLQIIEQADNDDSRVTAQKLIDSLQGKGPQALRVPGMDNVVMARDKLERILAQMLILGVVQEYFHFTPYNTISYIVKGPKAKLMKSGKVKVDMDFPIKVSASLNTSKTQTSVCTNDDWLTSSKPSTSSATPAKLTTSKSAPSGATPTKLTTSSSVNKNGKDTSSVVKSGDKKLKKSVSSSAVKSVQNPSTSTNSKNSANVELNSSESQKKVKSDNTAPQLVIINKNNSHFTNHVGTKVHSENMKCKNKSDIKKSGVKKRKPIIFDSDSDELDFDDDMKICFKPPIKKSKCKEKSVTSKQNGTVSQISDDDDDNVEYGSLELDSSIFDKDFESEAETSCTSLAINQKPIMIDSDSDSDVVIT